MIEDKLNMYVDFGNVHEALALIGESDYQSLEETRAFIEKWRVKCKSYGVRETEIRAFLMVVYRSATAGGTAVHGTISRGDWGAVLFLLTGSRNRLDRGEPFWDGTWQGL